MENKMIEYLENNVETLADMVRDCNGWDGSLECYEYFENDEEFFNMFFEGKPMEAVRASYYGNYNYMDAYVQFNAYGNLKSVSEWEREQELVDGASEIFDTWYELYQQNRVDSWDDNFKELLEEQEEEDED